MTTKNTLSLLGFLLFAGLVQAQPTLQSNVVPNIGDKVSQAEADSNTVVVGNPGINLTWNFSAMSPIAGVTQYEYISPVGTPYAANYPTATLVTKWGDINNGTTYGYTRKEANQYLILGTHSDAFIQNYLNPDAQLKFPTNYNGTYQDDYSYTTDAGTGFPFLSTGTHTVKYDAYGTLITPLGTFQNAMRIKAVTIQTDSANFFGNEIINHHDYVTYDWLVANQPGALVSVTYFHTISETRYPGIDTLFVETGPTKTVHYISAGSVGIFETPKPLAGLSGFSVGPNPAVDQVTLRFTADYGGELLAQVTDLSGKVLQTQAVMANPGDNALQLLVADLPQGTYFLSLGDGHSLQSWSWQKL